MLHEPEKSEMPIKKSGRWSLKLQIEIWSFLKLYNNNWLELQTISIIVRDKTTCVVSVYNIKIHRLNEWYLCVRTTPHPA